MYDISGMEPVILLAFIVGVWILGYVCVIFYNKRDSSLSAVTTDTEQHR